MKGEVVLGHTERAEKMPYETGKLVQNWARTFECRPQRFYSPKSEEQVIDVLPFFSGLWLTAADRESSPTAGENNSSGWRGSFTVRYTLFVRMDDVT